MVAVPVTCLDADSVLAFLDGQLPAARVAEIEAHIDDCAACRKLVSETAMHAESGLAATVASVATVETQAAPVVRVGSSGVRVGWYELRERLGGERERYRAYDPRRDRDVCLELVRGTADGEMLPDETDRAERVVRAAVGIAHPNLVTVLDAGRHESAVYVVTEIVDGESLATRMVRSVDVAQALGWLRGVARGLAAAHDRGVVHGGLSAEAVVVMAADERACIADLGVARLADRARERDDRDARSDVHAWGELAMRLVGDPERDELRDGVPAAVAHIIRRARAEAPAARFATARELAFVFEALDLRERPDQPVPAQRPPGERRRGDRRKGDRRKPVRSSRWLWFATPAIVLASGAVAWWLVRRGPDPAPPAKPRAVEPATITRIVARAGHILTARHGPDGLYVGAALGEGIGVDGAAAMRVYKRTARGELVEVPNTVGALLVAGDAKQLVVLRDTVADSGLARGTVDAIDATGVARKLAGDRTDITDAAVLPDGSLAVVRMRAGRAQIEAPLGTVVYRAVGPVWSLRANARGTLAFVEGNGTAQHASTLERGQPARAIASDGGWSDIASVAWDGERLLVSATRAPVEHALWTIEANQPRALWTSPQAFALAEVTSDRALVIVETDAAAHVWTHRDGARDRELALSDLTSLVDVSLDGHWVSLLDRAALGPPAVFARPLDGGAPVALGHGWGGLFGPDAHWVAARTDDKPWHIAVTPFQPSPWDRDAVARDLPQGDIVSFQAAGWLGDDLVYLADGAQGTSLYRQAIDGKPPRRIGPWPHIRTGGLFIPSPDGKYIADTDRDGNPALIEVASLGVLSLGRAGAVAGWTDDASAVFVADLSRWPIVVARVPVANPQAAERAFAIEAPGGGVLAPTIVRVAGDGRTYAYAAATLRSTLYRVEGVLRDDQAP